MSKESALSMAQPQAAEVKTSPVTGSIPENAKAAANPSVENGGVVPESLHSTQLSHLMKKEAKLQAEREAFKKEQEEFKSVRSRVEEVYKKAQEFEETRKKDPIKAMKDLGFTEKEIVDYLSQEEELSKVSPEERAQKAAQEEIKKFRDEEANKQKEAQKKKDEETLTKFRGQLSSVVKSNPEKYELSAYYGPVAEELMFNIALEEAKEGRPIDPASIADDVEEYYVNEFEALKKLKKLTPKEEAMLEAKATAPVEAPKPRLNTLTNKVTATSASLAKPVAKVETREQKRARLEQMIRNGLVR